MNIYEIRIDNIASKTWVAANTVIEALKVHESMTEMDLVEFHKEDDIVQVPESDWENYSVYAGNNKEKTFLDWMKENDKPDIIASTVY